LPERCVRPAHELRQSDRQESPSLTRSRSEEESPVSSSVRRKLSPPPLSAVTVRDGFWAPRIEVNRTATIPIEFEQCRKTGRIDAWKLDWKQGEQPRPHPFWDSDVAKWIEAAAFSLATHPDPKLERRVDGVVDLIAKAQQPDGYLNSYFSVVAPEKRWANLGMWHELYCAGHLIEAAVAYAEATGKRKLLEVMCRYADAIDSVFGPSRRTGCPGHEEIELALLKLYRATGEPRYLKLALFFLNQRGRKPSVFEEELHRLDPEDARLNRHFFGEGEAFGTEYCQDHLPVRQQSEAVGHAVRAMYLYCGMADVAGETGDRELLRACRRLWTSVCDRRMYVTGGIGSSLRNEGFTADHDLPNHSAYAETCAAIGLVLWSHRMLELECDGRFADTMERALYNGALAGVSLDGRKFFYVNPLESHGDTHRLEWFDCACCPPNIARLLAGFGRFVYSQNQTQAWVHLYVEGRAELDLGGRKVVIEQKTRYPWKEKVSLRIRPQEPARFTLALRIPGWCRAPRAKLGGRALRLAPLTRKGYARIERLWGPDDRLELTLPMPVERLAANPAVTADTGRVALQRGPLVYCLESADNGAHLDDLILPRDAELHAKFDSKLLGGVTTISGRARRVDRSNWKGALYRPASGKTKPTTLRAVPYCVWDNRRRGEMLVWIRSG